MEHFIDEIRIKVYSIDDAGSGFYYQEILLVMDTSKGGVPWQQESISWSGVWV